MFDDSKRKRERNSILPPVEFERQQEIQPKAIHKTQSYSTARSATSYGVKVLRRKSRGLKEALADLILKNHLLKKS